MTKRHGKISIIEGYKYLIRNKRGKLLVFIVTVFVSTVIFPYLVTANAEPSVFLKGYVIDSHTKRSIIQDSDYVYLWWDMNYDDTMSAKELETVDIINGTWTSKNAYPSGEYIHAQYHVQGYEILEDRMIIPISAVFDDLDTVVVRHMQLRPFDYNPIIEIVSENGQRLLSDNTTIELASDNSHLTMLISPHIGMLFGQPTELVDWAIMGTTSLTSNPSWIIKGPMLMLSVPLQTNIYSHNYDFACSDPFGCYLLWELPSVFNDADDHADGLANVELSIIIPSNVDHNWSIDVFQKTINHGDYFFPTNYGLLNPTIEFRFNESTMMYDTREIGSIDILEEKYGKTLYQGGFIYHYYDNADFYIEPEPDIIHYDGQDFYLYLDEPLGAFVAISFAFALVALQAKACNLPPFNKKKRRRTVIDRITAIDDGKPFRGHTRSGLDKQEYVDYEKMERERKARLLERSQEERIEQISDAQREFLNYWGNLTAGAEPRFTMYDHFIYSHRFIPTRIIPLMVPESMEEELTTESREDVDWNSFLALCKKVIEHIDGLREKGDIDPSTCNEWQLESAILSCDIPDDTYIRQGLYEVIKRYYKQSSEASNEQEPIYVDFDIKQGKRVYDVDLKVKTFACGECGDKVTDETIIHHHQQLNVPYWLCPSCGTLNAIGSMVTRTKLQKDLYDAGTNLYEDIKQMCLMAIEHINNLIDTDAFDPYHCTRQELEIVLVDVGISMNHDAFHMVVDTIYKYYLAEGAKNE